MTAFLWALFAWFGLNLALGLLVMRETGVDGVDIVCAACDAALLAWTTYLLTST